MGVTYFKRFRMEIDLSRVFLAESKLPSDYEWTNWNPSLVDRHATAKFESFRSEIDSQVFPCLGESAGCRRLMYEITQRPVFLPQATWLLSHIDSRGKFDEDCGTIQGIVQPTAIGAIQNIGVIPSHRGKGLGRALVMKALLGFRQAGVPRVYLEVTAKNLPAVQLYRSIGFRLMRTTYKAVEVEAAETCIS